MKQHAVFFALFGALYIFFFHWRQFRKLALFLLGTSAPLAITALALWRAGVFERFWFWTVTYAREYALALSLSEGLALFKFTFPEVVGPNLLLWFLACAGLALLWWRKPDRASAVFATAFLVFSCLAVSPGLYFRGHYFVLLLPAIALLAGATVSSTRKLTWLLFGAILAVSIAWQSEFLFRVSPLQASHWMYSNAPFPEGIEIGDYLRTHSAPDARIAVLGSEPEIYFYAHRRSATGYIYTYGMMESQPFALTMQNEMIHDIETTRPEYIVFVQRAPILVAPARFAIQNPGLVECLRRAKLHPGRSRRYATHRPLPSRLPLGQFGHLPPRQPPLYSHPEEEPVTQNRLPPPPLTVKLLSTHPCQPHVVNPSPSPRPPIPNPISTMPSG